MPSKKQIRKRTPPAAATAATPKAALDVLTADGERVGAIALQELTLGRAAILEQIGSPFVTRPEKGQQRAALAASDILPAVYVLAHPARVSRTLLRDGRDAFDDAVYDFADETALADCRELGMAVARIIRRVEAVTPQGAPKASAEGNARSSATTDG